MVLIIKLNTIIKLLSLIPFMPLRIFVETMHFFQDSLMNRKFIRTEFQKQFSALIILKKIIKHEISILVGLNSFKYINVENFQNVYNI